jgi:prepilin-type N-terminal cleavage/methylation domain-containing protein/prepilin-type processing-associated H-X9-DG protein
VPEGFGLTPTLPIRRGSPLHPRESWDIGRSVRSERQLTRRSAAASGRPLGLPGPTVRRAGFSLLELLIVVAVILLLTTLMWGARSPSRQRQQREACQHNLGKLSVALAIYANDHTGAFPQAAVARTSEEALADLVPRYTVDTATFICPGSKDPALPAGESFRQRRISYAYFMGLNSTNLPAALLSDRLVNAQPKAPNDFAFSSSGQPPGNNHGKAGGNFLFVDGHVEFSPPAIPFSLGPTQGVVLLNPRP